MDMYFKDIAYLSMWKRLFMLLVEKDVKAVVNQRLLFEIFENVERCCAIVYVLCDCVGAVLTTVVHQVHR
jgi:hypothetical protein